MRYTVFLTVALLLLCAACSDDKPTEGEPLSGPQTWDRAVGGPGDEWAQGVAVTDDGRIIAVGSRGLFGNSDALILMTDPQGNALWEYVRESAQPSILFGVAVTSDNQIIAVGRQGQGEDGAAMLVVKCDRDGFEHWTRVYPSEGYDEARAVIATDDGGCIIAGTKSVYSATGRDLFVMRIDAEGNFVWRQSYVTLFHQDGFDLVEMQDGSLVVAGLSQLPDNTYQPMLLHLSRSGRAFDQSTVAHLVSYHPIAATCVNGNQVLLSAWHDRGSDGLSGSESDEQFFLLNAKSELVWNYTTPDNNGVNYIYDMVTAPTGGVIAVGSTSSRDLHVSARNIHVVRIDGSHNVDATEALGYHSFEDGYAIAAYPDGGYVIAGATRSIGHGGVDVYLVKTDAHGLGELTGGGQ